ncbi:AraC family transcriptional regulator [Chroococcidiopsis sp.]|uniref:AraC family transcriptional regulator n=1 Tax=Chroococcidiopsis sp. TaxID=3088168 RepID=UPI003F3879AF
MKTGSIAGTSCGFARLWYERTRDIAADSTLCQGTSQLSVESLTQVLVIHLLQHYSKSARIVTSQNKSLTHVQLQQAIDYIHAHLDRELSLAEIAQLINISPPYFANLFKRAMGISPHQYVIQQRVERAKLMLSKTDLAIADIALQVGFSSQSHLTQQFKRFTGMTPKQVR